MIILFVGLPVAGKTTAMNVAKEMGLPTVQSGDVIRDEITQRGLEYTKETDREIAQWFHDGNEEELVDRIVAKLGDVDFEKDLIVIDGFRDVRQLEIVEKKTGVKPYVISIIANLKVRVERAQKRGRFPGIDENYIRERDRNEIGRGLQDIMDMADEIIDTSEMTIDEFNLEIKRILEKSHFRY